MIQTDVLQKIKHPKYLDSWYFSSDSLPSWQSRWVYKVGAEVGTIDYGRLWLYWYHNGAPGFWGWVCWATPCSTYGCVWKYSIPPNSYFDRENDDNPVDLVVHYFQTNPYFNMFRCETTPVRMASSCLFSAAVFTLWMKSLTNWGASSGHFCRSSTSAFWSVAAPRLWPTRIGVTTMGPTIHCSCWSINRKLLKCHVHGHPAPMKNHGFLQTWSFIWAQISVQLKICSFKKIFEQIVCARFYVHLRTSVRSERVLEWPESEKGSAFVDSFFAAEWPQKGWPITSDGPQVRPGK